MLFPVWWEGRLVEGLWCFQPLCGCQGQPGGCKQPAQLGVNIIMGNPQAWIWQFLDSACFFASLLAAAAGPAVMMAAAPGAAAAPAVEEKTTFELVLEDIPADKKVGVYKVVRNIAGIAVNQVKEFTATLPKVLKEGLSKEDANAAKAELETAGAKAKVRL